MDIPLSWPLCIALALLFKHKNTRCLCCLRRGEDLVQVQALQQRVPSPSLSQLGARMAGGQKKMPVWASTVKDGLGCPWLKMGQGEVELHLKKTSCLTYENTNGYTSSWNQKRPKKPLKYGNDFLNAHLLPQPTRGSGCKERLMEWLVSGTDHAPQPSHHFGLLSPSKHWE